MNSLQLSLADSSPSICLEGARILAKLPERALCLWLAPYFRTQMASSCGQPTAVYTMTWSCALIRRRLREWGLMTPRRLALVNGSLGRAAAGTRPIRWQADVGDPEPAHRRDGCNDGRLNDSEFSERQVGPGGMFVAKHNRGPDFPDTPEHMVRNIGAAGPIT